MFKEKVNAIINGRREGGFTLIELLVVIAIIGILSSVVLASLNSARAKSRDARRVADVKQLQLALELYFDSCGRYPADSSNALATSLSDGCPSGTTFGDFIASIPVDPSTGTAYRYADTGTSGSSYHLGADLESSSHSSLDADADVDSSQVDGPDADGCADGSGVYCYDVIP